VQRLSGKAPSLSTKITNKMKTIDEKHPYIAHWVQDGTIEIGYGDYDDVFLRAIDTGGVIWESDKVYQNLDDAFADLEAGIKKWYQDNGIEFVDPA
jgi:hypothetical protein